ncbi:MAG: hypothetical protein JW893_04280 [Candidatus Omnitrophica bacterium]|nr:hypothetical protein [Candidatus Omnitrophota bacterium]
MIKFLTTLLLFVVIVVLGLNLAGHFLVSKVFSDALGVSVQTTKLHFNPLKGEAGIYGLKIHNPEGFQEKLMASVPEIFIRYDLKGLLARKIHIEQIRFNMDQITIERGAEGQTNLLELPALKAMLKREEGAPPAPTTGKAPEKEPAAKGTPFSLMIDELIVSVGRGRYVDNSRGEARVREFPMNIQNQVFKDVTDPNRVIQQIVLKTLQEVGLNALMPDLDQFSTAFSAQAASKMEEIKEGLSGLFSSQ